MPSHTSQGISTMSSVEAEATRCDNCVLNDGFDPNGSTPDACPNFDGKAGVQEGLPEGPKVMAYYICTLGRVREDDVTEYGRAFELDMRPEEFAALEAEL